MNSAKNSAPDGGSDRFAIALATWFGTGFLPKAPGTWGSLAALPFAWLLLEYGGLMALALATLLFFAVGIWAADRYVKRSGRDDPAEVVIDEVVGQWLTIWILTGFGFFAGGWFDYALAFVAFRFFDIWKPYPIGWIDKSWKGGLGIMADDALAAVLAASFGILAVAIIGEFL